MTSCAIQTESLLLSAVAVAVPNAQVLHGNLPSSDAVCVDYTPVETSSGNHVHEDEERPKFVVLKAHHLVCM